MLELQVHTFLLTVLQSIHDLSCSAQTFTKLAKNHFPFIKYGWYFILCKKSRQQKRSSVGEFAIGDLFKIEFLLQHNFSKIFLFPLNRELPVTSVKTLPGQRDMRLKSMLSYASIRTFTLSKEEYTRKCTRSSKEVKKL